MEQIIMASHIVKPTSPTPVASKQHKLSFLDQMAPAIYIPHIYLYKNDESKEVQGEEMFGVLKQSLSEVLTIFYPLAGTIKQKLFVDCDDTGVEFVEARVGAPLAELLENPKREYLRQLVAVDSWSHDDSLLLRVKVSLFECGGIAVGMCLSHKIADGSSAVAFMNAWAASCRGDASRMAHPYWGLASHFPPREPESLPPSVYCLGLTQEKMVTRRLVFDREKLGKLRREAAGWCDGVRNPSRVEAFSVFIWRSFMEANKARRAATATFSSCASHVVNLRPRAVPPLPGSTFGNCYTYAFATAEEDKDEGLLLSELSAAIRAVDGDYINRAVSDASNGVVSVNEEAGDLFETGNCAFTSWWRFPFYDVDFGWGKPAWVCTTPMPYMNGTVLMSTPSRDGIEAWINVADQHFFQFIQSNYDNLLISTPTNNYI